MKNQGITLMSANPAKVDESIGVSCPSCQQAMIQDGQDGAQCVRCRVEALGDTSGKVPYKALSSLDKFGLCMVIATLEGRLVAAFEIEDRSLSADEAVAKVGAIVRDSFRKQVHNGHIDGFDPA